MFHFSSNSNRYWPKSLSNLILPTNKQQQQQQSLDPQSRKATNDEHLNATSAPNGTGHKRLKLETKSPSTLTFENTNANKSSDQLELPGFFSSSGNGAFKNNKASSATDSSIKREPLILSPTGTATADTRKKMFNPSGLKPNHMFPSAAQESQFNFPSHLFHSQHPQHQSMQLFGLKPPLYSPQSLLKHAQELHQHQASLANDRGESKRDIQERKLCNGRLFFLVSNDNFEIELLSRLFKTF
jgi:hypothetical protein